MIRPSKIKPGANTRRLTQLARAVEADRDRAVDAGDRDLAHGLNGRLELLLSAKL